MILGEHFLNVHQRWIQLIGSAQNVTTENACRRGNNWDERRNSKNANELYRYVHKMQLSSYI